MIPTEPDYSFKNIRLFFHSVRNWTVYLGA